MFARIVELGLLHVADAISLNRRCESIPCSSKSVKMRLNTAQNSVGVHMIFWSSKMDKTSRRNLGGSTSFVDAKHISDLFVDTVVLLGLLVDRLEINSLMLREVERDRGLTACEPRISTNVMRGLMPDQGMSIDRSLLHQSSLMSCLLFVSM